MYGLAVEKNRRIHYHGLVEAYLWGGDNIFRGELGGGQLLWQDSFAPSQKPHSDGVKHSANARHSARCSELSRQRYQTLILQVTCQQ